MVKAMLVAASASSPRLPIIITTIANAALRIKVCNPAGAPKNTSFFTNSQWNRRCSRVGYSLCFTQRNSVIAVSMVKRFAKLLASPPPRIPSGGNPSLPKIRI